KSRAAAHRYSCKDVGLALGPNGIMFKDKIPDVAHDPIFKGAGPGVEVKTAGFDAGVAVNAAVGRGDDRRRQLAARHGLVERFSDKFDKGLLVLSEAMQPKDEGIALGRIKAGRKVNV